VLVELIEVGLQTKEAENKRFIMLAGPPADASKAAERRWLKQKLTRMTFGG